MKKGIIIITVIMLIIGIFLIADKSYAENKVIDEKTESKIIEIKVNKGDSVLEGADLVVIG